MNRIWKFTPWLPYEIGLDAMVGHCSFVNSTELHEAGYWAGEFRAELPVAQLKLTLESFDTDCFMWESRTLVSERMRRAMALDPSAIQFFDVDASRSAPLPRSMNYRIMNVPVTEDVSDPAKSSYMSNELTPGGVKLLFNIQRIEIRPDARPAHDLFYDKFFRGDTFCTDAFALRVLHAGCTGVRFFEPTQLSIGAAMRFRTLRGIEEEGEWDPVKKIEHTTLVEAIPH